MPESLRTRLARWTFNWFPAYRGTGAQVTYIAADWSEVRLRLPLSRRTRNYVGTLFGGSMYGAVDPIYMVMLIQLLGPEFVVWDKSATIRFRRPGRETLYATFRVSQEELANLRAEVDRAGNLEKEFAVDLVSASGEVHASCQKLLSIRRREGEGIRGVGVLCAILGLSLALLGASHSSAGSAPVAAPVAVDTSSILAPGDAEAVSLGQLLEHRGFRIRLIGRSMSAGLLGEWRAERVRITSEVREGHYFYTYRTQQPGLKREQREEMNGPQRFVVHGRWFMVVWDGMTEWALRHALEGA